jgi:hypothetical protein
MTFCIGRRDRLFSTPTAKGWTAEALTSAVWRGAYCRERRGFEADMVQASVAGRVGRDAASLVRTRYKANSRSNHAEFEERDRLAWSRPNRAASTLGGMHAQTHG